MGKILLLNPPGAELYLRDQHCSTVSKANYYWPPIDLLILSGLLHGKHEIKVIDAMIEKKGADACLNEISSFEPDFIIFITAMVSWIKDFSFIEKVKMVSNSKLIASGGFLLSNHTEVMKKYSFLDAVLLDYTSESIINYIEGKDVHYDMCIRSGDNIQLKPPSNLKQFSIPVPRHELFPLDKYRLPHNRFFPFSSVLANYGCPYNCCFCVAENIDFKYRPAENVIKELEYLVSLGVREVFFKDFTFGIPKNEAVQLCHKIIERLPKLSWICASRVNVLDEEMLKLMKKAGCHTIQFGVESASQDLLDNNKKMISIEQIKSTFNTCRELKIKTLGHFILGLPGETEGSLKQTVMLAKEINCDYASFNVAIPLYGTSLRKQCIENNWLKSDQEELDSSMGYPVIETPSLSRESLWKYRNYAVKAYYLRPSYIFRKFLTIRCFRDFKLLFGEGFSLIKSIIK